MKSLNRAIAFLLLINILLVSCQKRLNDTGELQSDIVASEATLYDATWALHTKVWPENDTTAHARQDSLVEWRGDSFFENMRWTRWWIPTYWPYKSLNRGIGGMRIRDVRQFIDTSGTRYDTYTYLVHAGTNDIFEAPAGTDPTATIKNQMRLLRATIRKYRPNAHVFLCEVSTSGQLIDVGRAAIVAKVNEAYQQIADEDTSGLTSIIKLGLLLNNPNGSANPIYWREDRKHPNDAGYDKFKPLFIAAINSSKGKSSDTVPPTPSNVNKTLTARAGPDATINILGSLPLLNANASMDTAISPKGWIKAFQWRQVSGPTTLGFVNANAGTTRTTGSVAVGKYVFEIKVTSGSNLIAYDQVEWTVFSSIPAPSNVNKTLTARAGPDATINILGSLPLLNANASMDTAISPKGWIKAFQWRQVSGPTTLGFVNANAGATRTTGSVAVGKYVFEIKVTSGSNLIAYDQVEWTVFSSIPAPSNVNKTLTARAGPDATINILGSLPLLNANASMDTAISPKGWIKAFQWRQVSGPTTLGFVNANAGATRTTGSVAVGKYVFEIKVTSGSNLIAYDQVEWTITK